MIKVLFKKKLKLKHNIFPNNNSGSGSGQVAGERGGGGRNDNWKKIPLPVFYTKCLNFQLISNVWYQAWT